MIAPVIRLEAASVHRRHAHALNQLSLTVTPGEFVGVLGPNGAGKTTLLTVINGLTPLSSGQAEVLGTNMVRGGRRAVRARIGYVAQVERCDPRLPISLRDTVMTGRLGRLGLFHTPAQEDWAKVDEAMAWVGIGGLADRPLGQVSGGEYQRAAIARALAQEPDLLLFDEPTASLDPRAQRAIIDIVQRIHQERGVTILYVTHDLVSLPQACTRLLLMRDGILWRDGEPAALLTPAILDALYDDHGQGGLA